jgi:hypothetical protein
MLKNNRIRYCWTSLNIWSQITENRAKKDHFVPFIKEWCYREHLKDLFIKTRLKFIKHQKKLCGQVSMIRAKLEILEQKWD